MPLPELIEIVPLAKPVQAEITVPGSKSITNRALILAALAEGETILRGALWSEDTQVMADCLGKLGFQVKVERDPDEFCNRRIAVQGRGGQIPNVGTEAQPLELFVGNAGTAARFLAALVCLGQGVYRLHGIARMHERPQAALFSALRQLGYRIESPNDKLPATIHATGPRPGKCQVSIEYSSQFASALLLCAPRGGWQVQVVGENAEESSYIAMTSRLVGMFSQAKVEFEVEPDTSSGSYFLGASWLLPRMEMIDYLGSGRTEKFVNSRIQVNHWPNTRLQIDQDFKTYLLPDLGASIPVRISRSRDLGDSIMTATVLSSAPNRCRT